MTSALEVSTATEVAVRQAPLTATESPSLELRGELGANAQARSPSEASTASTLPKLLDDPSEHQRASPLSQPRPHQNVLTHLLEVGRQRRGRRRRSASHRRPREPRAPPPPATQRGAMKSRISSTSPASNRAPAKVGPPRPAVLDPPAPELVERAQPPLPVVAAGGDDDLRPRSRAVAPRAAARGRRPRSVEPRRIEVTSASRVAAARRSRRPRGSADGMSPRGPGGEKGIIGERGADAHRDGVALGAPPVHELAALHARDPAGVARRRGDPAVEGHRGLVGDQGRPVRARLRKGWLSSRAAPASSRAASSTSTPPSRSIPGPRPEALSVGSSEA